MSIWTSMTPSSNSAQISLLSSRPTYPIVFYNLAVQNAHCANIPWGLVRHAVFCISPQTSWIRICIVNKIPRGFACIFKFEKYCPSLLCKTISQELALKALWACISICSPAPGKALLSTRAQGQQDLPQAESPATFIWMFHEYSKSEHKPKQGYQN